jgi:hypothetical protein
MIPWVCNHVKTSHDLSRLQDDEAHTRAVGSSNLRPPVDRFPQVRLWDSEMISRSGTPPRARVPLCYDWLHPEFPANAPETGRHLDRSLVLN